MQLIKFVWISERINGGIQICLKFCLPWECLLVGYAGTDVDEFEEEGVSAFKASLFIPLFELEFVRVRLDQE